MFKSSALVRKKHILFNMEAFDNVLLNASEFIKGRLFFVSLNTNIKPKSTPSVHYFSIDNELSYESFYLDFGPLNLAMLYHYCVKLRRKLSNPAFANKKIVHCTGSDVYKRVNAAFLIGAYSIIYLDYDPDKAYEVLNHDSTRDYLEFRDASLGEPFTICLLDCLRAIKKALTFGFFNFDNFDFLEYEHYERVENGDFNWIVPHKFIAFCGPQNRSQYYGAEHTPETYFAYFRRHKVSTIIRLNKKAYDSNKFVQAGFDHKDLYFVDGGTPSDRILQHFINICEDAKGAIAVHCKAGLGRTGSLIACYIMKHWKFTAEEAIAWIRICRPGSVIGHQQSWLQDKQKQMWDAGEIFRKKHGIPSPQKFSVGIYSLSDLKRKKSQDNVTGIMRKVDCMEINDPRDTKNYEEHTKETQGDKLNEIKAQRSRIKSIAALPMEREKLRRVHVTTTTTTTNNQTVLRGGKIVNAATRTAGSSSSRVMTKRLETPTRKIATTRKLTTPIIPSNDKFQLSEKRPVKTTSTRQNGLTFKNGYGVKSEEKPIVKRTKRALVLEKDKCSSPRSVKVLRRSHMLALSFKDETIDKTSSAKLCLPSVKQNKSI